MQTLTIHPPDQLKPAIIDLPSSKSISNRLLILNALSYSPWPVKNLSDSDDTRALYTALHSNATIFNVGAAGTTMRFLTAFLSRIVGEWTITGSERMKERPSGVLVDALREIGAKIDYLEKEGYPPLKIFGSSLQGKTLELPGNISSQYISALLMIAPRVSNGLTLKLIGDITSRPYLHLTLKLMEQYGVKSVWKDDTITVPEQPMTPVKVKAEADWSAASYWFQIVALSAKGTEVVLKGLERYSLQGDSKVAELFESLGVKHKFSQKGLVLTCTGETAKRFAYNFTDQPDLAQTFAVTCACLGIPFHLTGLHTLKIKETDRITALINESRKLGFVFTTNNVDDLCWNGTKEEAEERPLINTYHDHRMAMAFAPACLTQGALQIENPSVVRKSYPGFWDDMGKAGFVIENQD
jgi:3-phosphoshikimate 1-carboxyvinyltransferase